MSQFPAISATDLDGRHYDVPGGLPAGPRVVIVASKRWQQVLVEMWKARLRRLEHEFPNLGVWSVAALPKLLVPVRPLIDGGMRAELDDPRIRRRTLTAYVDTETFASALGVADLETVHAFLLGPDGEIMWSGSGKPAAEDVTSLGEMLAWWNPGPERG
ncbi:MAG: hypothetical protein U1E08_07830 [Coriobacteriia bacterium]|nr:hypothetical protein [Actinomycetota bacterium]MDZ4167587.1 hypothetical protein [Coriobacteriia bacterium]